MTTQRLHYRCETYQSPRIHLYAYYDFAAGSVSPMMQPFYVSAVRAARCTLAHKWYTRFAQKKTWSSYPATAASFMSARKSECAKTSQHTIRYTNMLIRFFEGYRARRVTCVHALAHTHTIALSQYLFCLNSKY